MIQQYNSRVDNDKRNADLAILRMDKVMLQKKERVEDATAIGPVASAY